MRRNVRERVQELAPFLTFDQDPYIVVGEDGRLYWLMDAFTTATPTPMRRRYRLGYEPINYVRNSVKILIDGFHGATTFYVFDTQDPIIGRLSSGLSRPVPQMHRQWHLHCASMCAIPS